MTQEPTIDEKLDAITIELAKLSLPNDTYVHTQISDILDAVKNGDDSVLEVVGTVKTEVVKINNRLLKIEKWRERVMGGASVFAFLAGSGILTSIVILLITG